MPPQAFGVGILLAFLGASSWAFHGDASRVGTWRHVCDRIGMFLALSVCAILVLNATYLVGRGRVDSPRSCCSLMASLGSMVAVSMCVVWQARAYFHW